MPPKKKLSKKEKQRLEAEQAELARIEMEKEKLRKLEEERERMELEREQAEQRQQQEIAENKIRRKQLKDSMEYFEKIKSIIDAIKIEEKQSLDWDDYMRCNGMPNAQSPGDLRQHIHMWKAQIAKQNKQERNWLLQTDERTLLSHDLDIPDLSRKNLRRQQGNLGDNYSHRIQEILGILYEIDRALQSETLSAGIIADLRKLKIEIRILLRDYIDDFTCRILSHIERDMDIAKAGVLKHDYTSEVFKSQILAMQGDSNAQKDGKLRVEPKHTEIEFPLLELQLLLPPAVKIGHSAMRGLWLNYDHFSDICSSFCMPIVKQSQLDLLQQTKKEWKKRKEILLTTLEEASKVIEPEQTLFDAPEEQKPRVIDVDKVYTEYEDELNKARRRAVGPEALNLTEFEVNLRKYRIVGGVYCVDYLEQPQQDKRVSSNTYIRTIVVPEKLTPRKFYQSYKPPPPPLPGVRRLPEEIEAEMRMMERNLDKLAQVSLQLSPTVCWFEPPVVCRWENQSEFEESEREPPMRASTQLSKSFSSNTQDSQTPTDLEQFSPRKSYGSVVVSPLRKKSSVSRYAAESRRQSRKQSSLFKSATSSTSLSEHFGLPIKEVNDFDICNIPPKLDIYGLITDFVIPRLPQGYCIRLEYETPRRSENRFLYLSRDFEKSKEKEDEEIQRKLEMDIGMCKSIEQNLFETGSPRPFYPRVVFKKILQIKSSSSATVLLGGKNYDDELGVKNSYMFSQLLEDLDALCEFQTPFMDQKVNEISSKLSSPRSSIEGTEEAFIPPRKFSGIIIIRDNEIPTDRKQIAESDDLHDEDRESSSELDDDEEEEENLELEEGDIKGKLSKKLFKHGRWSSRDVHDSRFNEDKLTIQFRTGRLGFFGFASNRYSNMPYQTWEVKPDFKNQDMVHFSLSAAVINIEMTITSEGFCLTTFQGAPPTDSINEMMGKTLSMSEMKSILTHSAVDIFPERDAFCYTEGSCEKNYVMEMHLYNCISTLGLSHNFTWSRWNLLSGSRVCVLLMREFIDSKKVPNHSTLYVTPLKALVVDCTEVSASFTTAGVAGMEYYADLHQLTEVHAHPNSKEKQAHMDPVLRDNIAQILMSTRPLSFC